MLALTYHDSNDVRVDTVPDPILQEPDDIILKITATVICGLGALTLMKMGKSSV